MNVFFSQCPNLVSTHVKEFNILSCVHVHLHDSDEIQYSIFCDGDFRTNKYAGEEEATSSPRYSGVQYKLQSSEDEVFEGLVVGMFEYKPVRDKQHLFLLINRFTLVGVTDFSKRCLPQRLMQYHKVGPKITTDIVPIHLVQAPIFLVPALDKDMDIAGVGKASTSKQMFYLILRGKVWCSSIMKYDDYLEKNNTIFSRCFQTHKNKNINFKPYLSVEDMNYIKKYFDVHRNVKPYDSDILEDYEFNIEDDEEDVMMAEI